MRKIRFTKHALQRARERKLWKYVSKDKFWFDAEFVDSNKAKIDNCLYIYVDSKNEIVIKTMYTLAFP